MYKIINQCCSHFYLQTNCVKLIEKVQEYKAVAEDFTRQQIQRIRSHPQVQAVMKTMSTAKLAEYATMASEKAGEYYAQVNQKYGSYLIEAEKYWDMLMDRPEIQPFIDWVENVVNKV